ncbi:MAG: hypothetical protein JWR69_613, partial [Pedosphaera sp.]|nr:hypothetical protein [Pedosphaera sp.]
MTGWTLILRSLRFHARAHLGVVLGATVGSAALVGALVGGDSVRESLRELALARLGRVETAMASNDRFFRAELAGQPGRSGEIPKPAAVLELPGTAATEDAAARANHVQVLGVNSSFWHLAELPPSLTDIPTDAVVLNEPLAAQLKAKIGDTILLRVQKPSLLSRDAPLTPQEDSSVALRLKLVSVVSDPQFGRFSLQANQIPPLNAFVNLAVLQDKSGQKDRANLLLIPEIAREGKRREQTEEMQTRMWPDALFIPAKPYKDDSLAEAANDGLRGSWQLADAQLEVREVPGVGALELRSDRVFLDPPVVEAARKVATNAQPILTYFVNELRAGTNATPYSMVTAMGAPIVPAEMRDDEILINQWLADDLQAKPGDALRLTYFVIGNGRALEERQGEFHIRGILPLSGAAADRTLMPEFPGLSKAESSRDWDAGFPIQLNKIRDKDEKYWQQHRGTPKAFVTLA